MKRIARLNSEQFVAGDALAGHAELTQILKRHLPPSTAALFAKPKEAQDAGIIEWYSELGGQPVPFSTLTEPEAAQVRRLLDERLDSIQQLATRLDSQGADGQRQAALLRQAARYPDTSTLYSLNGQPVLTFWGYGVKPPPVVPGAQAFNGTTPSPATPGLNAAPPGGMEPPLTTPVAQPEPKKRSRWWLWLLLALLLAGLLAALWWFFCPEAQPKPPVEPPAIEEPKSEPKPEPEVVPLKEEPVAPEPEPVPEPEPQPPPPPPEPDPLDKLSERVDGMKGDCVSMQKLLANEPLLKESDARAVALKQKITQHLDKNCRQKLITEAKNLCPNERPKELAPELIMVFDASGSMDYSLLATQQEIQDAMVAQGLQSLAGQLLGVNTGTNPMVSNLYREPKRITAAKQAATTVVQSIPKDVNIGLVLIERCPGARQAGFFSPGQRGNLMSQLQNIRPVEGTPLADGVARAGQMLDGVNKESVMLVISDGEESCNQNPCAVAQQLAHSKPHLKINVVDIMGTGAGNCLANATGGKVYTARNANEISLMTNQAAQDVLGPKNCKKR